MTKLSIALALLLVANSISMGYTESPQGENSRIEIENSTSQQESNNSDSVQELSDQLEQLKEEKLSQITDPLTRAQTEIKLNETKARLVASMSSWAKDRQKAIAEAKMKQAANDLAMDLNNSSLSPTQVRARLSDFEKRNLAAYHEMYGPNAKGKLRETKEEAVKNYLSDTAVKNSQNLKYRINLFDDIVPATYKIYLLSISKK